VGIASLLIHQTMPAAQSDTGLAIQFLEANAGENLIAQETNPIKVRVMDRTGRAIAGANVLFVAPEQGPTGQFLPNANQVNIATDKEGMAVSPRFRTNRTVGDYQIQVIASYRSAVSRAIIPLSNVLKKKSSRKKYIILSALIGGAAAAALASRGKNAGSVSPALEALSTPAITIGGGSTPADLTPGTTSSSIGFAPPPENVQPVSPAPPTSSGCSGTSKSNKNGCR
jgi:hypothetical protein